MTAQMLLVGFAVLKVVFDGVLDAMADKHRKAPLPAEVADVYDADKYAEYLSYASEKKKAWLVHDIVDTVILAIIVFSGFFIAVDEIAEGNAYAATAIAFFLFWAVGTAERIILSYYLTFTVDEKYDLNRQDRKGFAKDAALDELPSMVLSLALMLFFVFVGEGLPEWTNGFSVGVLHAIIICAAVFAGIAVLAASAAALSVFTMMKRYRFEPLPEGELRSDIDKLLEGSKKKVREIYVYDESSKSTEKNAFLLKIFGYRFFGIADNFIKGNTHRELLAVLSHEVGHLKHKKSAWDFGLYAIILFLFACAAMLIAHPDPILFLVNWTQESFGLEATNYYLIVSVLGAVTRPLAYLIEVYLKCRSRSKEYEADREAVRNGYGRELEETLKRAERDELMNVNPHPVIEFLEYGHPGLANRVRALRAATESATLKDASQSIAERRN